MVWDLSILLRVTTNKVCYNMELERKYSVIQGNSGTGKTLLATFVEACATRNKTVQIQCDVPVSARISVFADVDEFTQFLSNKKGIVVLDENCLSILKISNLQVAQILQEYQLYYILITRETQLFNKVAVSVFDMYYLKSSGKFHTLEQIYPVRGISQEFIEADYIITEDESSGQTL